MTTTSQGQPLPSRRPRPLEILVLLAPFLGGLLTLLLPPLPPPNRFWEGMAVQSTFALAPLAVALSRCPWRSIGLSRTGLGRSLALGALYSLPFVALALIALLYGRRPFQVVTFDATRYLGVPLAVVLFLVFWGLFESVWMCYLIYTANRWLTGRAGTLSWRALFLAALFFGLLHVQIQLVRGAPLPQAMGSVVIGLALLIPGTIPKFTANAWGLVLWFTVTNFGF